MWAIRYDSKDNKTYFKGMCGIGPEFGATKETAMKFETKYEAIKMQCSHYGFDMSVVEEISPPKGGSE